MKEEIKVVYYVAPDHILYKERDYKHITKPTVLWGVLETEDPKYITLYKTAPIFSICGTPYSEFSETEWMPLPKDKKFHEMHYSDFLSYPDGYKERMMSISIKDKQEVIKCIQDGLLCPKIKSHYYINSELSANKKKFRFVKGKPSAFTHYGEEYNVVAKNYDTYEEAMVQAQARCDYLIERHSRFLDDYFLEDVDTICHRVKPENKELVYNIIINQPYEDGFCFRYYNGDVLYRNCGNNDYIVLAKNV